MFGNMFRAKHVRNISTPPEAARGRGLAVRLRNRSMDLSVALLYVPPIGDASAKGRKAPEKGSTQ
eukprot:4875532-Pyramimonas_sp.AAC.1